MGPRLPVITRIGLGLGELLGLIQIPISARRVERMMRVGKRDPQEERLVPLLDRTRAQIIDRALTDIGGGIKPLRDRSAQGLQTDIVMW